MSPASTRTGTRRRPSGTRGVGERLARVRRIRGEDVSFVAVAIVVVFGSLLGIVVVQTMIVQTRVDLDQVNAELDAATELNRQLRVEVIELEAPARVLEVAEGRLGMIRPDTRTYLPGVDPEHEPIRVPPSGDPFGPGPISDELKIRLGLMLPPPEEDG